MMLDRSHRRFVRYLSIVDRSFSLIAPDFSNSNELSLVGGKRKEDDAKIDVYLQVEQRIALGLGFYETTELLSDIMMSSNIRIVLISLHVYALKNSGERKFFCN